MQILVTTSPLFYDIYGVCKAHSHRNASDLSEVATPPLPSSRYRIYFLKSGNGLIDTITFSGAMNLKSKDTLFKPTLKVCMLLVLSILAQ